MEITSLFPTRIVETPLLDTELIADLETAIWMLEGGDKAGHEWCEREGYDGYTSYASLDDLPTRATAFAELKAILDAAANGFADTAGWDLSSGTLSLDAMWVNILGEGGRHPGHIHPGSVISGTTYIAVSDTSGAIRFEDPRLSRMMAAPPLKDDVPNHQKRFAYWPPNAGQTLMWESWLRHEVMENRSKEPRLSISFNYGFR